MVSLAYSAWKQMNQLPIIEQLFTEETDYEVLMRRFDLPIPVEYIPIYKEAAEKYGIHWPLLAAHHRIETRFSTMKQTVSPVGAEGPMQFMPCTFVGWKHPTCDGFGQGQISDKEKMDPKVIAKYGGYGVDGDGDGLADPFNIVDAIYSAANFLSKAGAKDGDFRKAIFQYNHSEKYVNDVIYYYELYSNYEKELLALAKTAESDS